MLETENLNSMCKDCQHLGRNCNGETLQHYSGCVWKNASDDLLDDFNKTVNQVAEKNYRRKIYQEKKEAARQEAIDWQTDAAEKCYSYDDLADAAAHFEKLGRRYGLTREFKGNGII